MDTISRIAYLNPLVQKAGLYKGEFWNPPEWVHINDLEILVGLFENMDLNLEEMIIEKIEQYPNISFSDFLFRRFDKMIVDNQLMDILDELIKSASFSFWMKELKNRDEI